MKKIALIPALAMVMFGFNVQAKFGAQDNVPAATLLLPHFDVDMNSSSGHNTVLTVGNRSNAGQLAHVTLWTDVGIPVTTFDINLAANGVTEIDLGTVLRSGVLPASSGSGSGCSFPLANWTPTTITNVRNALTGAASSLTGGQCGGRSYGDGHARGFVTIDAVNSCTALTPRDPAYFADGGTGIGSDANVLWGEYAMVNPGAGWAHGDTLMHIEASTSDATVDGTADVASGLQDMTFYSRIRGETTAVDDRERLLSAHWGKFQTAGAITATSAIVWRDPGQPASFTCGSAPSLGVLGMDAFDAHEEPLTASQLSFPLASQMAAISGMAATEGVVNYHLQRPAELAPFVAPIVMPPQQQLVDLRFQAAVTHVYTSGTRRESVRAIADPEQSLGNYVVGTSASTNPQCSDGIDNDGDSLVDYPADPACISAMDYYEYSECSDGVDNDGDMLADFPADPGCRTLSDMIELDVYDNQCGDGIDNDGDGMIDWPADTLCSFINDTTEANQCSDGVDNDADGSTDYPLDTGCQSAADNNETNFLCNDGIDNDSDGLTDFPADPGCGSVDSNNEAPLCNNGIDDDSDGFIDYPNDPGCQNATSGTETTQCNDGVDNDSDGFIDFPADPSCEFGWSSNETRVCSNGNDDDFDGYTDYPNDPGCPTPFDNNEGGPGQCADGIDNDGNGTADFPSDPFCTSANDEFETSACSDHVDNDFDGTLDFVQYDFDGMPGFDTTIDPGCESLADNNEVAGVTLPQCSDGIDNDNDRYIDWPSEPGCTGAGDDNEFLAGEPPFVDQRPVPALGALGMLLITGLIGAFGLFAVRRRNALA